MVKDIKEKKDITPIIWGSGILFCLLILLISLFINTDNNKFNNNDNSIYNTNKDFINDKEIDNVTFTNIECFYDGFTSLLTYTITNNSKNNIILNDYELIVKDKDNNILAIMVPGDTKELKPSESLDIGNSIDINLTKATKLELNKIK